MKLNNIYKLIIFGLIIVICLCILYSSTSIKEGFFLNDPNPNNPDCTNCFVKPNSGNCIRIKDLSVNSNNDSNYVFYDTSYIFCPWESDCLLGVSFDMIDNTREGISMEDTKRYMNNIADYNINCCSGNSSIFYQDVTNQLFDISYMKSLENQCDNYSETLFNFENDILTFQLFCRAQEKELSGVFFEEVINGTPRKIYEDLTTSQQIYAYINSNQTIFTYTTGNAPKYKFFTSDVANENYIINDMPWDDVSMNYNLQYDRTSAHHQGYLDDNNLSRISSPINNQAERAAYRSELNDLISYALNYYKQDLTTLKNIVDSDDNLLSDNELQLEDIKRNMSLYMLNPIVYNSYTYNLLDICNNNGEIMAYNPGSTSYLDYLDYQEISSDYIIDCSGEVSQNPYNIGSISRDEWDNNLLTMDVSDRFGVAEGASYQTIQDDKGEPYIDYDFYNNLPEIPENNVNSSIIGTYLNAINSFYQNQVKELIGPRTHAVPQTLQFDNNSLSSNSNTFFTYDGTINNDLPCETSITGDNRFEFCSNVESYYSGIKF